MSLNIVYEEFENEIREDIYRLINDRIDDIPSIKILEKVGMAEIMKDNDLIYKALNK